jgi:hypothetical protein
MITQPRRRALLEALIEAAIAELDALDGDCDLEEDGTGAEPSLGSMDGARHMTVTKRAPDGRALRTKLSDPLDQTRWSQCDHHDLEQQCDDEGGQCDDEGADTDSEPDDFHTVPTYEGEAVGDQTKPILCWG